MLILGLPVDARLFLDGDNLYIKQQARFYREVKPFFDGNINIDTIKRK